MRTVIRFITLAALVLGVTGPAQAQSLQNKLDLALQQLSADGTSAGARQRVIIRANPAAREIIKGLLTLHGDNVYAESSLVQTLAAELHVEDFSMLLPYVDSMSLDADVLTHASKNSSNSSSGDLSFLKNVLGVGGFALGGSVTVAVVDSGLQANEDFTGRVVGQFDFVNGKGGVSVTPYDDHGHGTHVAGLIGSSGAMSGGKYAGVATAVKLLPLKVLDKQGRGRTSDVIAALEWAVRMKDVYGISIVNLSLGHPVYEPASRDPLVLAVEAAVRAGLVVVASAGNFGTNPTTGVTGYAGITSPGNAPSAITVGSSNPMGTIAISDDQVTRYSSRGPTWYDGIAKPDIVAPGQGLVSDASLSSTLTATYTDLVVYDSLKKFMKLSGTSMATAVVSGVAALMIDVNRMGAEQRARQTYGGKWVNRYYVRGPDLSPNAVKAVLQYSALKLKNPATGLPYDRLTQGTGMVNGLGAVWVSYFLDNTVAAGSQWLMYAVPPTTTLAGETHAWAQEIIWGTQLMAGSGLVEIRQGAWAANILWGQGDRNIVWGEMVGDNIVWTNSITNGQNIVWSVNIVWAENIVWSVNIVWAENIVWGEGRLGVFDGQNIIWGYSGDNIVWGMNDNIVWSNLADDNIVWSNGNWIIRGLELPWGGL